MRANWTGSVLKAAIGIGLLGAVAYGFSSGPPAGRTGAPGEGTCVQCHLGTLNSGPGRITISGVPETYEANKEITLTVRVGHSDRDTNGDGIISFAEADLEDTSDGGRPNDRLFIPVTEWTRFAVTREINDGLLAPRFAPSERAWVLSGLMGTVTPAVPASTNRDGDNR